MPIDSEKDVKEIALSYEPYKVKGTLKPVLYFEDEPIMTFSFCQFNAANEMAIMMNGAFVKGFFTALHYINEG